VIPAVIEALIEALIEAVIEAVIGSRWRACCRSSRPEATTLAPRWPRCR
jgi:hypothetical protein